MSLMLKIQAAILAASNAYDINPDLVNAIVKVESGYEQFAVGSSHGEIGLLQLRPRYHPCASFDILENVYCGVKYLSEIKQKHGEKYPKSWFVFYNYGPYSKIRNPKETEYYAKVMEAM